MYETMEIPEKLKNYVNAYKINLVEISYLPEETVKKFKSDFGIVADFFTGKRDNKDYRPKGNRKFKHVDEMLKLLSVLTNDIRYETIISDSEKGEIGMCDVPDRAIQKGIKEGRIEGKVEGLREGRMEIAYNMLQEGVPDSKIIFYTKVEPKELEKLKKSLGR